MCIFAIYYYSFKIANWMHPENFLRCWCFDCEKIFYLDGDESCGQSCCCRCRKKNFDFDLNGRYSGRKYRERLPNRKINTDSSAGFLSGGALIEKDLVYQALLRLFPEN